MTLIEQVNERYKARDESIMKYLTKVKKVMQEFKKCSIEQIPQSENSHVNTLSKLALACPS